jgi:SAM-dependent methyltransferase
MEDQHWWFLARRQILCSLASESLPANTTGLVVDVGCGTGGNTAALAEDFSVHGIDASPTAIEIARGRFPELTFTCGDASEILKKDGDSVSLFLISDVLEHVRDDFLMLTRLFALARPGALFLITVPAEMALWSEHDESHGHYRRYSQERFERLWQGLPLTPLLVSYFNARLYPVIKLARMVSQMRGKSSGLAGTDLTLPPRPVNAMLQSIFAGEQKRLLSVLQNRTRGYRRGVSLIALLRRESGEIVPRPKPADLPPDYFDPERAVAGNTRCSAPGR